MPAIWPKNMEYLKLRVEIDKVSQQLAEARRLAEAWEDWSMEVFSGDCIELSSSPASCPWRVKS